MRAKMIKTLCLHTSQLGNGYKFAHDQLVVLPGIGINFDLIKSLLRRECTCLDNL
jgi:hypothetical protein